MESALKLGTPLWDLSHPIRRHSEASSCRSPFSNTFLFETLQAHYPDGEVMGLNASWNAVAKVGVADLRPGNGFTTSFMNS